MRVWTKWEKSILSQLLNSNYPILYFTSKGGKVMSKRILLTVLILTVTFALCVSIPLYAQQQGDTIKIGAIFPLTGPLALSGNTSLQGATAAVHFVNRAGGVLGKKVELIPADAPDGTAAANEAERLISVKGAKVIVGSMSSTVSMAASPVAGRHNVIYWETGAIADDVTGRGLKSVFRTITRASSPGSYGAEFSVKFIAPTLGIPIKDLNMAVLYEDGPFGAAIAKANVERLEELKAKVVFNEGYTAAKATDFSSAILKLKANNVHILYHTGAVADSILFFRQARELDLNLKAVLGAGSGYNEPDFARALGKDADGIFNFVPPTSQSINQSGLSPKTRLLIADVMDYYKSKGIEWNQGHDWAFTGTWMLLTEVIPRAGSIDPDAIIKAAYEVEVPNKESITGYGFKLKGDPGQPHAGQNTKAFTIVQQWQGGKLYCVYPEFLALRDIINLPLPPWDKR
jgi:branched-chain amino acid transport system substrate-binding protein